MLHGQNFKYLSISAKKFGCRNKLIVVTKFSHLSVFPVIFTMKVLIWNCRGLYDTGTKG